MSEFTASLKTVNKWENELNCKLEKDLCGSKVKKIKCSVCKKYESSLKDLETFHNNLVRR